jgi:hypothetical protein
MKGRGNKKKTMVKKGKRDEWKLQSEIGNK